jgi:hypothetical protein
VTAVAVDKSGSVFLVYQTVFGSSLSETIHEYKPNGEEAGSFELTPREAATARDFGIDSIALDPAGRLAVSEHETYLLEGTPVSVARGSLYEVAARLHLLTEFPPPLRRAGSSVTSSRGMAFAGDGKLYAVNQTQGGEVVTYSPLPVAELLASPASCLAGPDMETDASFACTLSGAADPWKVAETEVFFEWGRTPALGSLTARQPVVEGKAGEAVPVTAPVGSPLPPNAMVHYRLAGFDHNVKEPESPLRSETTSLVTPTVAPRAVGEPEVSFVRPFSAVMSGELNPENAGTEYFFEYGPCGEQLAGCSAVQRTKPLRSSAYGRIGTTATGWWRSTKRNSAAKDPKLPSRRCPRRCRRRSRARRARSA